MSNSKKDEKIGQLHLPLMQSDIQKTALNGIEMGVLENGIPYLSQRGLVKMTGVPRRTFQSLSDNWISKKHTPIGQIINNLLLNRGYTNDDLFIEIDENGRKTYAYTEPVCLAIIEYYAFEAKRPLFEAINSFRVLARAGFRKFVYDYTGYDPEQYKLDNWRHFHDRVDMTTNNVPTGYFSIFIEIAQMIVPMIRSGVIITDKVVPDISVGLAWGKYWTTNNMGDRVKYEHNYPDYYRQSLSNPQDVWAYPDEKLGEFRQWFRDEYIESKFPKYLLGQRKKGSIDDDTATKLLGAVQQPRIEKNKL
jgi:hypothetical protein